MVLRAAVLLRLRSGLFTTMTIPAVTIVVTGTLERQGDKVLGGVVM